MKTADIVLVRFPFTDLENSKKRPALVLKTIPYSSKLKLVQIAMITSQIDLPEVEGDYLIQDWKKIGLLHPSKLRLSKIATIEGELIQSQLGALSPKDKSAVSNLLSAHFSAWR
jgi:mRNA interferase MazF